MKLRRSPSGERLPQVERWSRVVGTGSATKSRNRACGGQRGSGHWRRCSIQCLGSLERRVHFADLGLGALLDHGRGSLCRLGESARTTIPRSRQ
jgi:hypothetical protein